MKEQTITDMINNGATEEEAQKADMLFEFLRPCLKIRKDGLVNTSFGSKSKLGLYRTIYSENY